MQQRSVVAALTDWIAGIAKRDTEWREHHDPFRSVRPMMRRRRNGE